MNEDNSKTISVLLVDDSESLRTAVKNILESQKDIKVIAEAEEALTALTLIEENFEGVVVIDINMPGLDGITAAKQIKKMRPELFVIVLSFQADLRYVQNSLNAGASGFVLKENAFEELARAIREVANGHIFISKDILP